MYVLLMSEKIVLFTCTAGVNADELKSDCLLKAQIATYHNIKICTVYMTQTTAKLPHSKKQNKPIHNLK